MRRPGRAPRKPKTRHPSHQRSRVYVRRPKRRRASLSVVKHATSPEAKRHKSEYDTKFQSTPERVKYREELLSERRKRGIAGKGGPDMSHTKRGTLVAESPHANRARHFKERGTLKSTIAAYNQLFEYDTVRKMPLDVSSVRPWAIKQRSGREIARFDVPEHAQEALGTDPLPITHEDADGSFGNFIVRHPVTGEQIADLKTNPQSAGVILPEGMNVDPSARRAGLSTALFDLWRYTQPGAKENARRDVTWEDNTDEARGFHDAYSNNPVPEDKRTDPAAWFHPYQETAPLPDFSNPYTRAMTYPEKFIQEYENMVETGLADEFADSYPKDAIEMARYLIDRPDGHRISMGRGLSYVKKSNSYDVPEHIWQNKTGVSMLDEDIDWFPGEFVEDDPEPMSEAEKAQHALVVGQKHGRKGQQYAHDEFRGGRRGRGGRGKGSGVGDSARSTQSGGGEPPENKRIGRADRGTVKWHSQKSKENLARQNAGPLWNMAHRLIEHIEDKMNEDQKIINHDRQREAMQSYRATGKSGLTNNDDDYWGHIDARGLLSDDLRTKLYKPKLQGGQYVKVRGASRASRFHETPMGEDPDVQYRAPRTVRGGQMLYEELQPEDMMEILQLFSHGANLHNEAYKGTQFAHMQMDAGQYMNHLFNERSGGQELAEDLLQTGFHEKITREMDRLREEGDIVDLDELGAPKATDSSTGLVRVAQSALARQREHETTALDRMRYGGRDPFKPKTEQERALDMVKPRGISVVNDRGRRSKVRAPHHAPMNVPTMFGPLPISTKDIDIDSRREGVGRIGVRAARPTQINPITGQEYGADPNVVDVDPSRTISAPDKTKQLGQGE